MQNCNYGRLIAAATWVIPVNTYAGIWKAVCLLNATKLMVLYLQAIPSCCGCTLYSKPSTFIEASMASEPLFEPID